MGASTVTLISYGLSGGKWINADVDRFDYLDTEQIGLTEMYQIGVAVFIFARLSEGNFRILKPPSYKTFGFLFVPTVSLLLLVLSVSSCPLLI